MSFNNGYNNNHDINLEDEETVIIPNSTPFILPPGIYLEPMNGTFAQCEVDLKSSCRLGRSIDSSNKNPHFVGFMNKVVSRNHAELFKQNGKVLIYDLGSSSGTFVNNVRLSPPSKESQPVELKDGDLIQLGTDFTQDPALLEQDHNLRCVIIRILIRTESIPPPSSQVANLNNSLANLTFLSSIESPTQRSPSFGTPPMNMGGLRQKPGPITMPTGPSSLPLGTPPTGFDMRNRALTSDLNKWPSSDDISSGPGVRPPILPRKPSLAPPSNEPVINFNRNDADQITVSITREKFLVTKIQVIGANGKDVFSVNVKAWSTNRKLLIQDHRCTFTKIPYMEVIQDMSRKDGSKYQIVNQNGGALIASIDKKGPKSCIVEAASGNFTAGGDFENHFVIKSSTSMGQNAVAEVLSNSVVKNGGNISRQYTVFLQKEVQPQLPLAVVVVMGLLLD